MTYWSTPSARFEDLRTYQLPEKNTYNILQVLDKNFTDWGIDASTPSRNDEKLLANIKIKQSCIQCVQRASSINSSAVSHLDRNPFSSNYIHNA
jgi:hypothetical protein